MPPKRGKSRKAEKPATGKSNDGGRKLRPKNNTDFKQLNSGKVTAKSKKIAQKLNEVVEETEAEMSLSPSTSDDDLDADCAGDAVQRENTSNSATPDDGDQELSDNESKQQKQSASSSKQKKDKVSLSDKVIERALSKYMKRKKRKKAGKSKSSKKRRQDNSPSTSEESSDSDTVSSSSYESDEDSYSSDETRGRKRKRHHRRERKTHRRDRRGKTDKSLMQDTIQSPSQSTVYTRGCKSPPVGERVETSGTDSDKAGHINSDADTDEFISSLETSFNQMPSVLGSERRRRDKTDADERRQEKEHQQEREDEESRAEVQARDRADKVIRDIQKNKADLAKPPGMLKRQLQTLLIDFNRFHLTSHVDKKLKQRVEEGDFTVDFRKLMPKSKSKSVPDDRMQLVNRDGGSYFVPAEKEGREITCYKHWEVAFKVFMGVVIGKWPDKSQELLEYSHVIQTAAQTYPWENVFNYDIGFREVMTDHPE